jgi:hypothetical protein
MLIKLTPDEAPGHIRARFTATHANVPVLEGSFILKLSGQQRLTSMEAPA